MTYLHTHPWAIGNQHLLIVYTVLVYLWFIVLRNLSVSMMGYNQEVSAYWICYQLWNVRMIEHQLEVGVDGVSPWRPDATVCHVTAHMISKGHPLSSVQRKTRQRRQKEFGCTRVCVSVRVHSCSFPFYHGWYPCAHVTEEVFEGTKSWVSDWVAGAHNSCHAIEAAKHVSGSDGTWCAMSAAVFLEAAADLRYHALRSGTHPVWLAWFALQT